jgi:hypothetical protein
VHKTWQPPDLSVAAGIRKWCVAANYTPSK